ncbi:hypothetical protein QC763_106015 [Podospora pseudopauciseta]|uniref:Uncharacterized protein n=1 Tax=Podospora pseudopauciseta TaxID=2093780 RepID=A0ABR0HY27_9PEZI|nr:hypothetical protein QC763_106015 [Podospora pseudopauciseta]
MLPYCSLGFDRNLGVPEFLHLPNVLNKDSVEQPQTYFETCEPILTDPDIKAAIKDNPTPICKAALPPMGTAPAVKTVEAVGEGIAPVPEGSGTVEFDGLQGSSELPICTAKSPDFDPPADETSMV